MSLFQQKTAQQDDLKQTLHHYYLQVKKVEKQRQLQLGNQPQHSAQADEGLNNHCMRLGM